MGRAAYAKYGLTVAAVGAAYLVRLAADPVLEDQAPFLPFVLPVVFAVLVAGRGPGLLAGFLSLAAGFSLIDSGERFTDPSLVQALLFALVCALAGRSGPGTEPRDRGRSGRPLRRWRVPGVRSREAGRRGAPASGGRPRRWPPARA